MGYIDHLTEYFLNERRRLSSKAAVMLIAISTILLIDNTLGFSYSYRTNQKISQLGELNMLIRDSLVDSATKRVAVIIREDIIGRKSVMTQIWAFVRAKTLKSQQPGSNGPIIDTKVKLARSNFWFNLTAAGSFLALGALMIPIMLLSDKTTSISQRLATGIGAAVFCFLCAFAMIWLLGLIPLISGQTWGWNYAINFLIQFGVIYGLVWLGKNKT